MTVEHTPMKTDKSTGLPVLPVGYYWFVRFEEPTEYGQSDNGFMIVELKKELPPKWWKRERRATVGYRRINLDSVEKYLSPDSRYYRHLPVEASTYPALVKKAASAVFQDWSTHLKHVELMDAHKNAVQEYAGAYPPKSLLRDKL